MNTQIDYWRTPIALMSLAAVLLGDSCLAQSGAPRGVRDTEDKALVRQRMEQCSRGVQRIYFESEVDPIEWPDWMVARGFRVHDSEGRLSDDLLKQAREAMSALHSRLSTPEHQSAASSTLRALSRGVKLEPKWCRLGPDLIRWIGRDLDNPRDVYSLRRRIELAQYDRMRTPDRFRKGEAEALLKAAFKDVPLGMLGDDETIERLLTTSTDELFVSADAPWVEAGLTKYKGWRRVSQPGSLGSMPTSSLFEEPPPETRDTP